MRQAPHPRLYFATRDNASNSNDAFVFDIVDIVVTARRAPGGGMFISKAGYGYGRQSAPAPRGAASFYEPAPLQFL